MFDNSELMQVSHVTLFTLSADPLQISTYLQSKLIQTVQDTLSLIVSAFRHMRQNVTFNPHSVLNKKLRVMDGLDSS